MGFQCITPECFWCSPNAQSGCAISAHVLRKGTCRHYMAKSDKRCLEFDRTDLPGKTYISWANKDKEKPMKR